MNREEIEVYMGKKVKFITYTGDFIQTSEPVTNECFSENNFSIKDRNYKLVSYPFADIRSMKEV